MKRKQQILAYSSLAGLLLFAGSSAIASNQAPSTSTQACPWVSVLIEQEAPPLDSPQQFANEVHTFAPNLEQIHLRVAPATSKQELVSQYSQLITDLRNAYGTDHPIQIGFHPDNSKHNEQLWGCQAGDWQCVFKNSIQYMQDINKTLPKGQGFNIFSIEQSYQEPADAASLQQEKQILVQNAPGVTYGYVSPSVGQQNMFGPNAFDYNYPQFYNLIQGYSCDSKASCQTPPFPQGTYGQLQPNVTYNVIDAHLAGAKPVANTIPINVNDETTIYSSVNPTLASDYAAYLFHTKNLNSDQFTGATTYLTLSGEPEFFGNNQDVWTPEDMDQFHTDLINKLKAENVDTSKIKFAIWNVNELLSRVN